MNFGNKVNAITPAYAKQLRLLTQKTDLVAEKIDGSSLETYIMIINGF